ncbi:MAG: hypothetical protein HYU66_25580 [Armatimonadetes bacterium]|nr:hypothetical protein [Armatimonadota bacterium]
MSDNARDWADYRDALDARSRATGDEGENIVLRVTRTGARRAQELLDALERGEADGVGERLTDPISGLQYFMYDVHGYDGSNGYGP